MAILHRFAPVVPVAFAGHVCPCLAAKNAITRRTASPFATNGWHRIPECLVVGISA